MIWVTFASFTEEKQAYFKLSNSSDTFISLNLSSFLGLQITGMG